jgi:hypothetical protein
MTRVKIKEICEQTGLTPMQFAEHIGLGNNAQSRRVLLSNWQKDGVKMFKPEQARIALSLINSTKITDLFDFGEDAE